jgi:hypothetical protein
MYALHHFHMGFHYQGTSSRRSIDRALYDDEGEESDDSLAMIVEDIDAPLNPSILTAQVTKKSENDIYHEPAVALTYG